jgi:DNA-binding SARP family transcriptional activator
MLGPLEVRDGEGETIPLPRRQQRALLGALLVRVGEVVSTDRLIDDLWGESPPPAAKGALQNTVWQLRKAIGADLLRTQPPGYVLDVDPECVDARRFERLLAEAAGRPPADRAALLREALALWRGPALADLLDERWAEVEGARLEELKLSAIEDLIDAELELGRHAAVVAQLETLTTEHRFRERLWRQRALALYRCGRQNEALAALREVAAALDQRGLELTAELRQLERGILNQDPSLDAPSTAQAAEEDAPPPVPGERRVVSVVSVVLDNEDDPELLRAALDRLLKAASTAVAAHGGELEAFGPEGLSAVFGASGAHEDDALRAVRAALAIHEATGSPAGIATGDAVIAEQPRVAGAAVTRAAGLARLNGGVLADPRTFELVRNAVKAERFGPGTRILSVAPARPQPGLETRLVGRAHELAALREMFAAASEERRCRTVTLLGEAGIGKTRLARELVSSLDATVLVGRCAAYGEGATFLPLVEALRDVDPTAAGDELVERRIAGLAGAAQEPGSLGESYWAVRRLLEELARLRPVALFLDDVHWAEPALLDLVEYLRDRVTDAPLFVLCLARPELLDARPGWAAAALALEPLADEETSELVAETAELEEESRERIVELAEGNPLYAQQLATYAAESGKALEPGAMPATIDAVLAGRLGRLEAGERATLQRAAVVGREFSRGAVAALAPPDLAVDAHLLALARRGFVRAAADAPPGDDAYRFHHVLLRDAAYATLTKEQRADLHEKVAAWLDRDGPGDDALVGYHLEQAALTRKETGREADELELAAGERLGSAGMRASIRNDGRAAFGLLGRAAQLLPRGRRRAEVKFEWALVLHNAGNDDDADKALAEAAEEAAASGDRRNEIRAQLETARLAQLRGEMSPDELLVLAADAIAELEAAGDDRGLGRAWVTVSDAHSFKCEMAAMGRAAARGTHYLRLDGRTAQGAILLQALALVFGPEHVERARQRALELLGETVDRAGEAGVTAVIAVLKAMGGEFDEARTLAASSRATYEDLGAILALETDLSPLFMEIERLANDLDAAATIGRRSVGLLARFGARAHASTRAAQLADMEIGRGNMSEAARLLQFAKSNAVEHDALTQFLNQAVEARLLARRGAHEAATNLVRRAVRAADTTDALTDRVRALLSLEEVSRLAGRHDDARRAVEEAEQILLTKGSTAGIARLREQLADALPT